MEAYYLMVVSFLFILAISLLIVGVSNDAVNFLNSAIGSNAAPFRIVLTVAAFGILAGAVFSNGMMEVARKGIFNPEYFSFNEIMVIFFAVMLTNLLLLDFYNTFGLPTSTTVSIVFGILGGAVAVAIFKYTRMEPSVDSIGECINLENSVLIIAGIFISVIIAFTMGTIIQWIIRIFFTFRVEKYNKYWSGLWGGFAFTIILYFLVIKGAGGSTLITEKMLSFIGRNTSLIILVSFVGWSVIFQLLIFFTRVNILKLIVLAGTFALAMAFAGNDLVNFIGVPIAGFESFKSFIGSGNPDPSNFMMDSLLKPVNTPIYMLILAGLIMVITLRFSRKAISVIATTVDLSRQDEGIERFASSSLARFLVRRSVEVSNGIRKIIPIPVKKFLDKRINPEFYQIGKKEKVAFDLVRASVNLVVASILIAFGTSLKLPLSTTYVTFMVAMGTSLADGAWGRDSAVYRVTGVLTVIGGWFFTAFSAFLVSFLLASVIYFGKMPAIIVLTLIAIYILFRTYIMHRNRTRKDEKLKEEIRSVSYEVLKRSDENIRVMVSKTGKILTMTYSNFFKEKHKELKKLRKEARDLIKEIKKIKDDLPSTLRKFNEPELASGTYYVQVVTYMKEMSNSLIHIVQPAFDHLNNNHATDRDQTDELKDFNNQLAEFFNKVTKRMKNRNYNDLDELGNHRDEIINMANELLLSRIKMLKKTRRGVKINITYLEMISETKSLIQNVIQLVKANSRLMDSFISDQEKMLEEVMD